MPEGDLEKHPQSRRFAFGLLGLIHTRQLNHLLMCRLKSRFSIRQHFAVREDLSLTLGDSARSQHRPLCVNWGTMPILCNGPEILA
jgi:hypothetical protein